MIKGIRAILKVSTNTNKILRIINNIMDFLLFSVNKCIKFFIYNCKLKILLCSFFDKLKIKLYF